MEIKTDNYCIWYDSDTTTVQCQGSLRLSGSEESAPIFALLEKVAESEPEIITLNLEELEFLNSSGISMLSKFVINIRKKKHTKMVVLGSKSIPWQAKSLKNLQRLMPGLELKLS
ncbi:MAG: hypothetical protein SAJ37_15105 [Oscillatoria sp. PMC 1068.18]|nr:hypothetical protein [Oscillatoria sp. PMC 1068.18]